MVEIDDDRIATFCAKCRKIYSIPREIAGNIEEKGFKCSRCGSINSIYNWRRKSTILNESTTAKD